jgi:antitoxin component HigA of HigAB toxin-antitoxin module
LFYYHDSETPSHNNNINIPLSPKKDAAEEEAFQHELIEEVNNIPVIMEEFSLHSNDCIIEMEEISSQQFNSQPMQ